MYIYTLNGKPITLKRDGACIYCPVCHHYNALLEHYNGKDFDLKCRDCGIIVKRSKPENVTQNEFLSLNRLRK